MISIRVILEINVPQHHIDGQIGHQMAGTTFSRSQNHRDNRGYYILCLLSPFFSKLEAVSIFTFVWIKEMTEELPLYDLFESMCSYRK